MRKKVFLILLVVILIGVIFFAVNPINVDKRQTRKPKGDSQVVSEKKSKTVEIENPNSETGEKTEIKYDQYIVANGYAGASDNVYYTRDNTLYHLKLSTNTSTVIAEGVEKIEEDIDTILVYKGSKFKQKVEDDYLTYVD